jgi:hypothetical protein
MCAHRQANEVQCSGQLHPCASRLRPPIAPESKSYQPNGSALGQAINVRCGSKCAVQAARRLLPVYPYEPTNWRFVCTSCLGHNLTWPETDERPPPGGRQLRTLAIPARSGDRDSALLSAAARWPVDSPLQIKLGCLRRFSFGRSIGNTVRGSPNAVAAPATVSGEPSSKATGPAGLGRRRQAATREPGDLPSVVVTREHIGRGVLMSVELSSS